MSISLTVQQRLQKVDMIELYDEFKKDWDAMAKKAHDYIQKNFPGGYDVHEEDVCKALLPLVEVDDRVNDFLNNGKLRQKYWIKYFCDYILDQCWDQIHRTEETSAKTKK